MDVDHNYGYGAVKNHGSLTLNNRGYNLSGMTLADRIRAAREHSGLSQTDLAVAVGATQPMISKLERGKIDETSLLIKIAGATGVRPQWLDSEDGPMFAAHAAEDHAEYIPDPGAARSRLAMIARIIAMADADVRVAAEWLDRSFPAESGPVPPGIRDRTI